MPARQLIVASVLAALTSPAFGQGSAQVSMEPPHTSGQSITAAFEGWYPNADGSSTILIGYYNRNIKEVLDIPVGVNNRIDPGGPDRGQPTHFLPGRQTGMFLVTVPKDFPPNQRLTWTITFNGESNVVPFTLKPDYNVSPFKDEAVGNTPPVLPLFTENAAPIQGPRAALA